MSGWLKLQDDLERPAAKKKHLSGNLSSFKTWGTKGCNAEVDECLNRLKSAELPLPARRAAAVRLEEITGTVTLHQATSATRLLLKLLKAESSADSKASAARALCGLGKHKQHLPALSGKRLDKAIDRVVLILCHDNESPEAQIWAANLLRGIASRGDASRRAIAVHPQAPSALGNTLRSSTERLQEAGARLLREISICREACGLVATPLLQEALLGLLSAGCSSVRTAAAWAICTVACTPQQQQQLLSSTVLPKLMELAGNDGKEKDAAVWVLHNICATKDNVERVMSEGLLPILIDNLQNGSDLAREGAARIVSNIACQSEELSVVAIEAGALAPLMAILSNGTKHSRKAAVMAICQLALWEGNRDAMARTAGSDLVDQLAQLLSSSDPAQSEVAACALQNMAACPELRAVFLQSEAVPALVRVLHLPVSPLVTDAAGALLNLLVPASVRDRAESHQTASTSEALSTTDHKGSPILSSAGRIIEAGACPPLVDIIKSDVHEAREVAAQLLYQLLSCLPEPAMRGVMETDGLAAVTHLMGRWCPESPEVASELAALLLASMPDQALGRAEDAAEPLICMLQSTEPPCLQATCRAIAAVVKHCDSARARMVSSGKAIPRLGAVLSQQHAHQVPAAASALAVIATESDAARLAICRYCLKPLLQLVGDGKGSTAEDAASTLAELARSRSLRKKLLDAGALEALEGLREDGDQDQSSLAGLAVQRLTSRLQGYCADGEIVTWTSNPSTWTSHRSALNMSGEDNSTKISSNVLQGRQSLLQPVSSQPADHGSSGLLSSFSRRSFAAVVGIAKGIFSAGRRRQTES